MAAAILRTQIIMLFRWILLCMPEEGEANHTEGAGHLTLLSFVGSVHDPDALPAAQLPAVLEEWKLSTGNLFTRCLEGALPTFG
jgi:hypothetical protein